MGISNQTSLNLSTPNFQYNLKVGKTLDDTLDYSGYLWLSYPMEDTHRYAKDETVSIGDAARITGYSITTLRRWETEGKVKPLRTPGGQRRYIVSDLDQLLLERTA